MVYLHKLTIAKSGHQSTQCKKIPDALPGFCKDKNYKYIDGIISTNTELTEAYFLPAYPVKTQRSSMHHLNLEFVDPIVGLDVLSSASPTCAEMVEKSPIFNSNLQEQVLSDYDQQSKLKLQEWDKLIANKKSLITIISQQCHNITRTEIALGASYKNDLEAGELINFLTRVCTVCKGSDNGGLLFSSCVVKITGHNFWPLQSVEEWLAAHPTYDAIWDHTNPCDVSIDSVDNAEIITNSHIMEESVSTCRKSDSPELLQVVVSMSYEDDKSWFDAYEDIDSWYDASETLDKYDKWNKPPNTDDVDGINNEPINKCIKPDLYIGKRQT